MIAIRYSNYIKILLSPSTYLSDRYIVQLREDLSEIFFGNSNNADNFFLTENGRTGLYIFLKSLNLKKGDQVAVQPFTCNSAINPVIWNKLIPVYIDIKKDNLSMDPSELREALDEKDNRIKAVILQHTFGIPGDIEEIKAICNEYDILMIEDCAHGIGENFKGQMLGTFGDSAVISFGLEKQLPTKVGGAILINNNNLIADVYGEYTGLKPVSWYRTILWLINPLIRIITRFLGALGTRLISIFEDFGIFEVGFSKEELTGGMPDRYPRRISRPIARVVVEYIDDIKKVIQKRRRDSQAYKKVIGEKDLSSHLKTNIDKNVGYLKFPFYANDHDDRESLQNFLIENNVYLSDWYENAIYPAGTDHKSLYYEDGSCQHAEDVCETIINLPTGDPFNIKAIDYIEKYYGSRNN